MKLLFVCTMNHQRSPSFETWFKENKPQYEVKSAGTEWGSPVEINEELLEWADKIYLMDLSHEMNISRNYPAFLHKCEIVGCSDDYSRDSAQIKELIHYWCKKVNL